MKMTIEEFRTWARKVMLDPVRRRIVLSTLDTLEQLEKEKQANRNTTKPEKNHE